MQQVQLRSETTEEIFKAIKQIIGKELGDDSQEGFDLISFNLVFGKPQGSEKAGLELDSLVSMVLPTPVENANEAKDLSQFLKKCRGYRVCTYDHKTKTTVCRCIES